LAATSPYKNAATDGTDLGANFNPITTATAGVVSGADVLAPYLTGTSFDYAGLRQAVNLAFSEQVIGLTASDVQMQNLTTGAAVPAGSIAIAYDSIAHTARVTFSSVLADGNYRVTIPPGAVVDPTGNAMSPAVTFDFFVLAGDANHDRTVDLTDFTFLASNFNGTGKTFSDGDFNYDGKVDLTDFTMLAANFNRTLSPSTPAALAAAPAARAGSTVFSGDAVSRDRLVDGLI